MNYRDWLSGLPLLGSFPLFAAELRSLHSMKAI